MDRNDVLQVPTSVVIRIDNLTDNMVVMSNTTLGNLASVMEVNIPGSVNQMQQNWQGSQVNQLKVTATFADGSTVTRVIVYEILAIATVGGA